MTDTTTPDALLLQIDAVVAAARNVEWENHFGAQWDQRAKELEIAKSHLIALSRPSLEPSDARVEAGAAALLDLMGGYPRRDLALFRQRADVVLRAALQQGEAS